MKTCFLSHSFISAHYLFLTCQKRIYRNKVPWLLLYNPRVDTKTANGPGVNTMVTHGPSVDTIKPLQPLFNMVRCKSEPQTRAGPLLLLLLPSSPPSRFLHRLQTSITRSFIKLECFLRPFLKTRSHDESAHAFKSNLRFLEVPQKGVKKNI